MNNSAKKVLGWIRWLHIYLSMFSFATLMFFAISGITLNHTEWIEGKQSISQHEGELTVGWVHPDSARINELQIVEFLREQYRIRASVKEFITDATECTVSFKGPGFNADAFIDRATGHYELTVTESGAIAIINDLHKGRDTGQAWKGFIDISAGVMVLVSLSGFMMIFFLKKWRFNGLLLCIIGLAIIWLLYAIFV